MQFSRDSNPRAGRPAKPIAIQRSPVSRGGIEAGVGAASRGGDDAVAYAMSCPAAPLIGSLRTPALFLNEMPELALPPTPDPSSFSPSSDLSDGMSSHIYGASCPAEFAGAGSVLHPRSLFRNTPSGSDGGQHLAGSRDSSGPIRSALGSLRSHSESLSARCALSGVAEGCEESASDDDVDEDDDTERQEHEEEEEEAQFSMDDADLATAQAEAGVRALQLGGGFV